MAAIQMLQGAESRSPARQIRIHFRFRIGAIAKSSAPQWALYADTADREGGVSVFTLALKIKECQSRSWQGQDGVEYFGRGVPMEILAQFNVAKIQFLNQIAKSCCFGRSKSCH